MSIVDYVSSIFSGSSVSLSGCACNSNQPAAAQGNPGSAPPRPPVASQPVQSPAQPQPAQPAPAQPAPATPSPISAGVLITWAPTLVQNMDSGDPANWQPANWSNGDPFNCTWQPDNVSFSNGIMTLTLDNTGCPQSCDSQPYASAEYRTTQEIYGFGSYEVRMKAAAGDGLVSSFFTYRGTSGQSSHDEIDFEFLGKNCRAVQTNYYASGRGGHEEMIPLAFNACEEFHNYGFQWSANSLVFYVDGAAVRTVNSSGPNSLPYRPGKIMINFWPGTGVDGWLNRFTYPGRPLQAQYDWVKYSPLAENGTAAAPAPAPTPQAQPAAPAPAAATGPLTIESVQQGNFDFNNGSVSLSEGTYIFAAERAKDPGFGIMTGDAPLEGRNKLVFEIKGSLRRLGGYARFIAQVYDDGDNDYTPIVSLDPVVLSNDFQSVTVDLFNRVDKVKKVQFLLVTDRGNCQVEIRNLRFE